MTAAVLFDLDGTLTDREASVRSFAGGLAELLAGRLAPLDRAQLADLLVRCDQNGYNARRAHDLRDALPWRSQAPPSELLAGLWAEHFADWVVLRPGALELLDELRARGLATGLVTNGPSRGQRRKLVRLGLDERLDVVVVSQEVELEKPDPRIFALALERLAVTPGRACFVGDHPEKDVWGAESAGLRAVWIRGGTPWPAGGPPPRHAIDELAELRPLLGPGPPAGPGARTGR